MFYVSKLSNHISLNLEKVEVEGQELWSCVPWIVFYSHTLQGVAAGCRSL